MCVCVCRSLAQWVCIWRGCVPVRVTAAVLGLGRAGVLQGVVCTREGEVGA